jgi:hypothetical protein
LHITCSNFAKTYTLLCIAYSIGPRRLVERRSSILLFGHARQSLRYIPDVARIVGLEGEGSKETKRTKGWRLGECWRESIYDHDQDDTTTHSCSAYTWEPVVSVAFKTFLIISSLRSGRSDLAFLFLLFPRSIRLLIFQLLRAKQPSSHSFIHTYIFTPPISPPLEEDKAIFSKVDSRTT